MHAPACTLAHMPLPIGTPPRMAIKQSSRPLPTSRCHRPLPRLRQRLMPLHPLQPLLPPAPPPPQLLPRPLGHQVLERLASPHVI